MLTLQVQSYCRPFRQPLHTAHGCWEERTGLILRLEHEAGQTAFGEIAPLPWFGTETLAQAQALCDRWPRHFTVDKIAEIPDTLPACQFGFGSARDRLTAKLAPKSSLSPSPADICALLPPGKAALTHWQPLWQQGHRTFKWKIGVASIDDELSLLSDLAQSLPPPAQLRLDANGGLTATAAAAWLSACDRAPVAIEFLEQPLPPDQIIDWLPQIAGQFTTSVALDESVATLQQLQQVQQRIGNQVVYVVKPAIAGFPQRLLDYCLKHRLDVVLSSALETPIGRSAALTLAQRLWTAGLPKRALGFGVDHWFVDVWAHCSEADLWQQL
ncbi:MAG: o-succinylbenzoate synthase [Cyanobacteria bacterium P01_C01_bin.120]